MKNKTALGLLLALSLTLFLLHPALVNATSETAGQITWGTPLTVYQYFIIGQSTEVPQGDWCYVVQTQARDNAQVTAPEWEALMGGDLSSVKNDIETRIPGSQVTWLRISWSQADLHSGTAYDSNGNPVRIFYYVVSGFTVEAIVKNVNAGLTGAEIALIIVAFAVLAIVIGFLFMSGLIAWDIHTALQILQHYGPGGVLASLGIGILVLIILLGALIVILVVVMGGGVSYKGKKRTIKVGK